MTIRKNWTTRGKWIAVGRCVENEDDGVPDLILDFATYGDDEVSDKKACDIAKRIGILLNAFAGIKTNNLHKYVRRTR